MSNQGSFLWLPRRSWQRRRSEPGAQLFEGLRIRLTLWYCGVLGAALVLFGIGIYFGAQYFLLHPLQAQAASHAQMRVGEWLADSPDHACSSFGPQGQGQPGPPLGQGYFMLETVACYNANGNLLPEDDTTQLPATFLDNNLAKTALQTGQ